MFIIGSCMYVYAVLYLYIIILYHIVRRILLLLYYILSDVSYYSYPIPEAHDRLCYGDMRRISNTILSRCMFVMKLARVFFRLTDYYKRCCNSYTCETKSRSYIFPIKTIFYIHSYREYYASSYLSCSIIFGLTSS